MRVHQINAMKYEQIHDGMELVTKVRYGDQGTLSQVFNENNLLRVDFYAGVKGVAPGQSAVFFEGDDLVGGGIIYSSLGQS
jgi:tRNA-specific 2-thiouridylase